MSMALAEASIQSLLDFLRLNLWIWFDGFHKRGSLDKWKGRGGEGRRGEGWKELRMKERRSVTAWTILCAKNAELSSSTVKLDLSLMQKQRATHKIIAMVLCFCFCFCFFSSSPTCMNPCTSTTVLFWQAKKAKLGILLGFYLTNALECFAISHFATENPRITPTTKERSNHYTSSTQNA